RVHVEVLGTADAFQRQGLATQLVEAVEAWAREHGARFISARNVSRQPGRNPVLGAANGLSPPDGDLREASRLADTRLGQRPSPHGQAARRLRSELGFRRSASRAGRARRRSQGRASSRC
ncbi:MAG: GNAT family N-acetyltransferase, partial [Actinobacteria bacterium]